MSDLLIIGLSIGGFVLLILVLIGLADRHEKRRREWLEQHGEIISATVTRIQRKTGEEGGRYFVVIAQWTDPRTGSTYTFRKRQNSRPQYAEGNQIQVVVNQSKPGDYAILGQVPLLP